MGLEKEVGTLLETKGLTLALAESCTGGLLASRITDSAGSSAYFVGGVVAYANSAKERLLGVPDELIVSYGAVSREVALAMARGARKLFGVDVALSITGVAGPTGGTAQKPVGLVYIALVADRHEDCQEFRWQGTRRQNKRQSAGAALALLCTYLRGGSGAT